MIRTSSAIFTGLFILWVSMIVNLWVIRRIEDKVTSIINTCTVAERLRKVE